MLERDVAKRSLERIASAFELYEQGRTTPFALAVVIRGQADGLRAMRPDVAEPLTGLAGDVEAAGKDPRPERIVADLAKRFAAWRKDTVAVLDAEVAATSAPTPKQKAVLDEAERAARRERLLAEARAMSPSAAPAASPGAPVAATPKPAPKPADGEEELSMEEIQRLLDGAKK